MHPLVDPCNAASVARAIPVAVFDAVRITGDLEVRHAIGDERYLSFAGEFEHPEPGEVVFADSAGSAHSRRWTHRQSRTSAVTDSTATALVVCEALHVTALTDVQTLQSELSDAVAFAFGSTPVGAVLSRESPSFRY